MPGERKNQFYNRMNQTVQVISSIYVVKRIKWIPSNFHLFQRYVILINIYFKAVLKRKQYEEKFDVDVTDDPITGETKVKDRAKDEVLVLFESF